MRHCSGRLSNRGAMPYIGTGSCSYFENQQIRDALRVAGQILGLLSNSVFPDPETESFGDDNAAVGLLVVFENGDDRPCAGDRGAVEGVGELRPLGVGRFEANAEASGLVIGAVRSRGDFAI